MKDPQQVWQTLKNFDYPIILLSFIGFEQNPKRSFHIFTESAYSNVIIRHNCLQWTDGGHLVDKWWTSPIRPNYNDTLFPRKRKVQKGGIQVETR